MLTLLALGLVFATLIPLVQWLFVDAYWRGSSPSACPDRTRACWPFISAHWELFVFGVYPHDQRWRIVLGFGIGMALWAAAGMLRDPRIRRWALPTLLTLYVAAMPALLAGGFFGLTYVPTNLWGGLSLTVIVVILVVLYLLCTRHPACFGPPVHLAPDSYARCGVDRVLASRPGARVVVCRNHPIPALHA